MIKFSNVDAFLVRVNSRAPMGLRSASGPMPRGRSAQLSKEVRAMSYRTQ